MNAIVLSPLAEMNEWIASLLRRERLPRRWAAMVEAHPIVPNMVAIVGLVFIMFMLAPTVVHPSGRGQMVDSLEVVAGSNTFVGKVIALQETYHHWVPQDVRDYVGGVLFNPVLYFVLPFFLILEYLFPCNSSQPLVGKGFLQDLVWFVLTVPTKLLLLGAAGEYLHHFYEKHLAFLTIQSAVAWPKVLQIIAALFVTEFIFWTSHFIRHKSLSLWYFHAVHHSQTELNTFTDDRGHIVDRLVTSLLMFVPFYAFHVDVLYAVAVVGLYVSIHSRFVHTNVKINLGWLGWVVASPQFHRVHHSVESAHYDQNFAGVLSIFDYLFGTAHPSRDVYPETGISDTWFPLEEKRDIIHLFHTWGRQTMVPFRQLFKTLAIRRP
jgi:sterol desaturase/sphingolipid hydroxylase (fatty acid hydroxylase superfamily)